MKSSPNINCRPSRICVLFLCFKHHLFSWNVLKLIEFLFFSKVYLFKPSSGKLTKWSRQALEHGLPRQWTSRRSQVINIQFNPSCHEVVLLQDHNMFTLLDLREVFPHFILILYLLTMENFSVAMCFKFLLMFHL